MKTRRSDRLVDMTRYLLERPHQLISLSYFTKRYDSAKSSISEDLTILKRTFQNRGTGILETVPGAAGGTRFIPYILRENAEQFVNQMCTDLSEEDRYLPGGYVYMSDVLGQPRILNEIGRIMATQYLNDPIDVVMTVATKGVPIAQSVAFYLGVPFVIARHNAQITEGSTVSVNYVSASTERIERMALSKRSIAPNSRILIVDDYMKGGGTISGMRSLVDEFDSQLVGVSVFAEGAYSGERLINRYTSLLHVDTANKQIDVQPGNYLDQIFGDQNLTVKGKEK
ncbi:pur operon repressor [Levilactobacillus bambusae]|uniref:Pur operon repressor n=1 Tax=Levilactobacillus bambusae TaxID=2024736 RepID=A0A2V1MW05_9LACO|nr:pur operon repressor [Levilactobacillus bambusae]PWF99323.1 pur operon repressor [Levilactobacillus bambusae]